MTRNAGMSAVFQLDEAAYWSGHVSLPIVYGMGVYQTEARSLDLDSAAERAGLGGEGTFSHHP